MPNKKGKNNKNSGVFQERKIPEKTDDSEYGLVTKILGGSKFLVKLNMQEKETMCKLRGSLKHKKINNIEIGSVVLVGIRDFQDDVADIVFVYSSNEARQLIKDGELVLETNTVKNDTEDDDFTTDDAGFDFTTI